MSTSHGFGYSAFMQKWLHMRATPPDAITGVSPAAREFYAALGDSVQWADHGATPTYQADYDNVVCAAFGVADVAGLGKEKPWQSVAELEAHDLMHSATTYVMQTVGAAPEDACARAVYDLLQDGLPHPQSAIFAALERTRLDVDDAAYSAAMNACTDAGSVITPVSEEEGWY